MNRVQSFAPLLGPQPRVLILGSAPSTASLARQEYYGKPQNAFWRIMGELFAAGPELPYEERTAKLVASNVAVWDVLASCTRPGSLDSAIDMRTAEVNDIASLLHEHSTLMAVFFNGRKAEEVFTKRIRPAVDAIRPELSYTCLPSTSPAMASLNAAAKLARWTVVRDAVRQP